MHVCRVIHAAGAYPIMEMADVCAVQEEDHADCRTVARVPNIGTMVDVVGDVSRIHIQILYKMNGGGRAYFQLQNKELLW